MIALKVLAWAQAWIYNCQKTHCVIYWGLNLCSCVCLYIFLIVYCYYGKMWVYRVYFVKLVWYVRVKLWFILGLIICCRWSLLFSPLRDHLCITLALLYFHERGVDRGYHLDLILGW